MWKQDYILIETWCGWAQLWRSLIKQCKLLILRFTGDWQKADTGLNCEMGQLLYEVLFSMQGTLQILCIKNTRNAEMWGPHLLCLWWKWANSRCHVIPKCLSLSQPCPWQQISMPLPPTPWQWPRWPRQKRNTRRYSKKFSLQAVYGITSPPSGSRLAFSLAYQFLGDADANHPGNHN